MKKSYLLVAAFAVSVLSGCASHSTGNNLTIRLDEKPLRPSNETASLRANNSVGGGLTMSGPIHSSIVRIMAVNGKQAPKDFNGTIQVEANTPVTIQYKCWTTFHPKDTGGAISDGELKVIFKPGFKYSVTNVYASMTSFENYGSLGIRSKGTCYIKANEFSGVKST